MPSFVLSLALLLLVLLMLLAVSNRELIALTFLGISTVALPLSIWMVGAIALGFLLGLWILLLFRFGAAGLGSGTPRPGRRRANYGPEDFAVVDERFAAEGGAYEENRAYDPQPYGDKRYDDVYGQEQAGATDQDGGRSYATDRYPADAGSGYGGYEADYGTGRDGRGAEAESRAYDREPYDREPYDRQSYDGQQPYDAQQPYDDRESTQRREPQDQFSATSGYDSAPAASSDGQTQRRSQPAEQAKTTLQQSGSAADPSLPADWDDQYREDWTREELVAEPVLRDEGVAPKKLKRWFNQPGEGRPKLNLGGFGLGGSAPSEPNREQTAERSPALQVDGDGNVDDWQEPGSERPDRDDVYDADYRVVRQPENSRSASSGGGAEPSPQRDRAQDSTGGPETNRDTNRQNPPESRPQSEWDIESDLDW